MQIGCCWFDIKGTTLLNQKNDTSWKMPAVEFAVLEHLVYFRDQVLSKEQLLQQLPKEHRTPTKLQEAINRIRFFLGKQSAQLLETIDDQGFILHTRMKTSVNHIFSGPLVAMTKVKYGFLIAQIMLLIILLHSFFEPTKSIKSLNRHDIITSTGVVPYYFVPNEDKTSANIEGLSSVFIQQLELCDSLLWDVIFVSFSHDHKVTSVVLKREINSKVEVKNVKRVSSGVNYDPIDLVWLKRAGICG